MDFASGGRIPGSSSQTVPALLEPGFVINRHQLSLIDDELRIQPLFSQGGTMTTFAETPTTPTNPTPPAPQPDPPAPGPADPTGPPPAPSPEQP